MITSTQLAKTMGCTQEKANRWLPFINQAMDKFDINTPMRQAHFLAQIGHESARLVYVKELASGKDYDTGRLAERLGNTPEADGDGQRYKGRGLIQITGLTNYRAVSKALGIDFVKSPELLELPENAALSAAWFWKTHGLNELADQDWLLRITKVINGGQNGIDDRRAILFRAKNALQIV